LTLKQLRMNIVVCINDDPYSNKSNPNNHQWQRTIHVSESQLGWITPFPRLEKGSRRRSCDGIRLTKTQRISIETSGLLNSGIARLAPLKLTYLFPSFMRKKVLSNTRTRNAFYRLAVSRTSQPPEAVRRRPSSQHFLESFFLFASAVSLSDGAAACICLPVRHDALYVHQSIGSFERKHHALGMCHFRSTPPSYSSCSPSHVSEMTSPVRTEADSPFSATAVSGFPISLLSRRCFI
jgi:hypothetical protein